MRDELFGQLFLEKNKMKKNKQKSHKSAVKRFKVTGTGEILHRSQKIRHLKSAKSKRQLRALKQDKKVNGRFKSKIKKLLGIK